MYSSRAVRVVSLCGLVAGAAQAQPSAAASWMAVVATPWSSLAPQVVGEGTFARSTYVGPRFSRWSVDDGSTNDVIGASFYRRGRTDVIGLTVAALRPGCDCDVVGMYGVEWIAMQRDGWRRGALSADVGFRTAFGYGRERRTEYYSFGGSLPTLLGGADIRGSRLSALLEPGIVFGKVRGATNTGVGFLKTVGAGVVLTVPGGHRVTASASRLFVERSPTTIGVTAMMRFGR